MFGWDSGNLSLTCKKIKGSNILKSDVLVLGPCWDATQKEEGNLRRGVFQLKSGGAAASYRSQGQPRILMSFIVLMEQMFESLGPKYVISKVP